MKEHKNFLKLTTLADVFQGVSFGIGALFALVCIMGKVTGRNDNEIINYNMFYPFRFRKINRRVLNKFVHYIV